MGAGLRDGVPSSPGDDQEALLFVEAAPALETHSASVSTSWRTYLGLYLVEVISKVIGTPHPGWLPIGRSVTKTASDLGITDTCAAQKDPPGDRHATRRRVLGPPLLSGAGRDAAEVLRLPAPPVVADTAVRR